MCVLQACMTCSGSGMFPLWRLLRRLLRLNCLLAVDESRTSADAAAALGLQNTSRLKQQVRIFPN